MLDGNEKYFYPSTASGNPEYVLFSMQTTLHCYEDGSSKLLSNGVGYVKAKFGNINEKL